MTANHVCNLCGLPCVLNPLGDGSQPVEEGGLRDARVCGGYRSTAGNGHGALDDLTEYGFSLCEFCLDWLFGKFQVPVAVRNYMSDEQVETWRPAVERVAEDDWRHSKSEFTEEYERRKEARDRVVKKMSETDELRRLLERALAELERSKPEPSPALREAAEDVVNWLEANVARDEPHSTMLECEVGTLRCLQRALAAPEAEPEPADCDISEVDALHDLLWTSANRLKGDVRSVCAEAHREIVRLRAKAEPAPLSPEARAALDAGIKSAREKPLVDRESFAQYADDEPTPSRCAPPVHGCPCDTCMFRSVNDAGEGENNYQPQSAPAKPEQPEPSGFTAPEDCERIMAVVHAAKDVRVSSDAGDFRRMCDALDALAAQDSGEGSGAMNAGSDITPAAVPEQPPEPSPALREAVSVLQAVAECTTYPNGLVIDRADRAILRAVADLAADFPEWLREAIAAPEAEPSSALMHNIVEQACITFNRMPGPAERRALDEPEVYDTAHPDPNQRLTPYKYESTADSVDITGTGRTEPEDRLTPRTPGARR